MDSTTKPIEYYSTADKLSHLIKSPNWQNLLDSYEPIAIDQRSGKPRRFTAGTLTFSN